MTTQVQNAAYTILRIKRKRTEEPLDALVVESRVRRKKSRGGVGVFQFARTVEQDTWDDEQRRKALQEEISTLARETAVGAAPAPAPATSGPPSPGVRKEEVGRRYTIVKNEEYAEEREPTRPPEVISARTLPAAAASDFKMYDAVLAGDVPADPEMEMFMPLLKDYLTLHDISVTVHDVPAPAADEHEHDYVWDVFYHRPVTLSEWNAAANVGTLSGLPPSINDPYDSDSESEEEDEADEDSNAEEYYKNDYPDEESDDGAGSSDEFHEHSEEEEDREWR